MSVKAETATVYHSGRRRYLTLQGACRDAARERVFSRLREQGESVLYNDDFWRQRVDRLTRLYIRAFKRTPVSGGDA